MEVKVPKKCDRCGKSEDVAVSMETAQTLVEEANKKATVLATLKDLCTKLDPALSPMVIMYIRTEGGYTLKTLDNLCAKPEAQRNKGCVVRVRDLVNDIFSSHVAEPKERAPRKPRTPKPAEGQAAGETNQE
jgi:DNA-binding Xre family transcriptional regulator